MKIVINLLFFFIAISILNASDPALLIDQLRMGFEVETDGIKVQHDDEDRILVILESADGKWQLTTDTQDTKAIAPMGWVNLECRTVGGLTLPEVQTYTRVTKKILKRIKELCDANPDGRHVLRDGHITQIDDVTLQWKLGAGRSIILATKKPPREVGGAYTPLPVVLRPQLTFLFPLKMTRRFIQKILLPHERVVPRIFNLSNKPKEGLIVAKQTELESKKAALARCKGEIDAILVEARADVEIKSEAVAAYLSPLHEKKRKLEHEINSMKEELHLLMARAAFFSPSMVRYWGLSTSEEASSGARAGVAASVAGWLVGEGTAQHTDVDGFFLLLSSYVYDLFVENKHNPYLKESGPKGFLKMLSRFSFLAMYRTLSPSEQEKIRELTAGYFDQLFEQKIKPYRRDNPAICLESERRGEKGQLIEEVERITLADWLRSIFSLFAAVDLLAPPSCTSIQYAMGTFPNNGYPRQALIEARGYASQYQEWLKMYPTTASEPTSKENIDNIEIFIYSEATKFFGLKEDAAGA